MSEVYDLRKVFSRYKMPKHVKEAFDLHCDNNCLSSGAAIMWSVNDDFCNDYDFVIDKWLVASGAEPGEDLKFNGETVIILHR